MMQFYRSSSSSKGYVSDFNFSDYLEWEWIFAVWKLRNSEKEDAALSQEIDDSPCKNKTYCLGYTLKFLYGVN